MFFVLCCIVFVIVLFYGIDFFRFAKGKSIERKQASALKTDAGGVLFVQGNRTYYNMPNGERRRIADYAMDLTPGSRDMNQFTQTLDEARRLHENEKRAARKDARINMESVAKEVVSCETDRPVFGPLSGAHDGN